MPQTTPAQAAILIAQAAAKIAHDAFYALDVNTASKTDYDDAYAAHMAAQANLAALTAQD